MFNKTPKFRQLIGKLFGLCHLLIINCVIISLLQFPIPAHAQEGFLSTTAKFIGPVSNTIVGVVKGMYAQQRELMQKMAYNRQTNAKLAAMRPRLQPDQKFPECAVSAALPTFPDDICEKVEHSYQQDATRKVERVAKENVRMFKMLTEPLQNAGPGLGMRCLNDQKKNRIFAIHQEFDSRIRSLVENMENIRKLNEKYKKEQEERLAKMQDVHEELEGGGDSEKIKKAVMNELGNDPACKEVLDEGTFSSGFRATDKTLTGGSPSFVKRANDHNENVKNLAYDITLTKNANDLREEVRRKGIGALQGIEGVLNQGMQIKFAGVSMAIQKEFGKYEEERNKIAQKIGESTGYSLPAQDNNFNKNFNRYANRIDKIEKSKHLKTCMAKYAGKIKTIVESAHLVQSKGRPDKVPYMEKVTTIVTADVDPERILKKIKEAELSRAKNKKGKMIHRGKVKGKFIEKNLSYMYKSYINDCRAEYTEVAKDSLDKSKAQKVKEAKDEIEKLKKLNDQIVNDVIAAMFRQVKKCGESAGITVAGGCKQSTLDHTHGDFCISRATSCAKKVKGCEGKVAASIARRENKRKAMANNYNRKVEDNLKKQKTYLDIIRNQVLADMNKLSMKYKIPWEQPQGLVIPHIKDSKHNGEMLKGGGDLNYLQNIIDKMEKLPDLLRKKKAEAVQKKEQEYDEHIAARQANMQSHLDKWQEVASNCKKADEEFIAKQKQDQARKAQAQRDAQKKEKEAKEKAAKHCRKVQNVGPGCDDSPEDLYDVSSEVAKYLSPKVQDYVDKYAAYCRQVQNQEDFEDEDPDDATKKLTQLCADHTTWDSAKEALIDKMVEGLPKKFQGQDDTVRDYLESGDAALPKELASTPYGNKLRRLRGVFKYAESKTGEKTSRNKFLEKLGPGKASDKKINAARKKFLDAKKKKNALKECKTFLDNKNNEHEEHLKDFKAQKEREQKIGKKPKKTPTSSPPGKKSPEDQAKEDFEEAKKAATEAGEGKKLCMSKQKGFQDELDRLENQRETYVKESIGGPQTPQSKALQALEKELKQKEQQLKIVKDNISGLTNTKTPTIPELRKLNKQKQELEAKIATLKSDYINNFKKIMNEIKTLKEKKENLKIEIQNVSDKAKKQKLNIQLTTTVQSLRKKENQYQTLVKTHGNVDVGKDYTQASVTLKGINYKIKREKTNNTPENRKKMLPKEQKKEESLKVEIVRIRARIRSLPASVRTKKEMTDADLNKYETKIDEFDANIKKAQEDLKKQKGLCEEATKKAEAAQKTFLAAKKKYTKLSGESDVKNKKAIKALVDKERARLTKMDENNPKCKKAIDYLEKDGISNPKKEDLDEGIDNAVSEYNDAFSEYKKLKKDKGKKGPDEYENENEFMALDENDEDDICKVMEAEVLISSINDCEGKDYSKACVSNKKSEKAESLEGTHIAKKINGMLKSAKLDKKDPRDNFPKFGETVGSCLGRSDWMRSAGKGMESLIKASQGGAAGAGAIGI